MDEVEGKGGGKEQDQAIGSHHKDGEKRQAEKHG